MTGVLKNVYKRGVQQRRSTYFQECIIIHSFDLIGTKSII